MERTLQMKFIKSDNKKVTISVDDVKEDITPDQIKALMDFILTKNIFSFKGATIAAKEDAYIVSTQSNKITIA